MTDDRKAGIALIAGSLGGLLTMHVHPSGGAAFNTEAQVTRLATASAMAHSLALLSMLLVFLGACGLAKRLAGSDRLSFAAIVVYGFASVAIMIAADVSGFIVPEIMHQMVRDVASNAQQWRMVMVGIFQINQTMAQIFSVASSGAIILWCISALRNRSLNLASSIYGCLVGLAIILAIPIGLRLDVRGMAAVLLGQAIWFFAAGIQMVGSTE